MNAHPQAAAPAGPVAQPSAGASPATQQGNTPAGPDGKSQENARRRRPRPKADPMVAPRRPLKQITRPMMSLAQMNEAKRAPAAATVSTDESASLDSLRNEYLAQGAIAFPLVVSRGDLKQLRHHVMRLQSKGKIDVQDQEQFTPPIRLHRRDPRAPPSGAGSHFEEEDTKEDLEESKERERLEIQKEERRKVREENLAKIAPSGTKKPPAFQKKTEQKYRPDDTPEAKKRQLLRYEETLPWHLEDFDNKQTWVGSYESELSEAHIMLTPNFGQPQGDVIQIAPMERWYRFSVKSKAKQIEDADKAMIKTEKYSSFFTDREKRNLQREQEAQQQRGLRGLKTRVGGGADDEGRIKRYRGDDDVPFIKRESDADDIDFNFEEDFADDEEGLNGLFEGEEVDVKEAAEKLKRDQLGAAFLGNVNEEEVYRQEEAEKIAAELHKILEKRLRKTLSKREKAIEYDLSDNENPYESSSDSDTDSEAERQRAKEEEEKKVAEQNGKTADGNKLPSGASTKGSNTPSGAHKPVDINKKKRPGSPNLSEASGNESSRKKHKKKHDKLSDGSRKSSLVHLNDISKRGAASGSDSEMTDAGKSKRPKLKVRLGASPSGSPSVSRAGSPAASQPNGSRASSPAASASAAPKRLPTAAEIHNAIPKDGMNIQAMINMFKDRVDKTNSQLFIRLVKAVSSFDKQRSWLIPLPTMPSDEQINAVMRGQVQKAPPAAKSG